METFFTADTHFNHEDILKYTNRNFNTIEDMNDYIIEKWNEKVKRGDRIFILGDFAFSKHGKFINALNGKKHLIIGNHDDMSQDILRNFTSVQNYKEFWFEKKYYFILNHYCLRTWSESVNGSINLFGHSHGRLKTFNLSFDMGIDCNNYEPFHSTDVIKMIEKRKKQMFDCGRIQINGKRKIFFQDDVQFFCNMMKKQNNG